ncbi:uncharacterized protein LOC141631660 [Silene latifolia]|uniref:uncharacterized protein LOC141631660 n=1 Tax=Silene latifolia TaxID=37657 RepID=UPI003D788640
MGKNKTILDCWSKYRKSQKSCSSSTPLSRETQEVNHQSEQDDEHTSEVENQNEQCDPIQVENQSEQCDPMQVENQSEDCDQAQVENDNEHESPFIPSQNQDDEDELDLLPHDPAKRNPISSYPVNVRDIIRRGFIDKKACRPIPKPDFPQTLEGTKKRRFKAYWYNQYDWLEYSEQNDAAFCFVCYLFRDSTSSPGNDSFVDGGFRKWRKALERFKRHVGGVGSAHNEAKEKFEHFINQKTSIIEKVDKVSSKTKTLYKARLVYSLQCLRFLLKQGLAFRGHNEKESSNNRGNFLELLTWLAGRSESVAKIVLTNAPGNHQVTAPKIQKDLIKCCAKETTRLIVEDLDNDFFAILADESCDVSQKEQLALCLRYVNKKGKACESFLGVVKVNDTSSLTLMAAIKDLLDGHSLSMSNIRGQGYDGASNMRVEGVLEEPGNLEFFENPFGIPEEATMAAVPMRDKLAPKKVVNPSIVKPPIQANNFDVKASLLQLVQGNQFGGGATENPNEHLNEFLDSCDMFKANGVLEDAIRLRLFPYSLRGSAKEWLKSCEPDSLWTWDDVSKAFLNKYFPPQRTARIKSELQGFTQQDDETLYEAWERYKGLQRLCPHHGIGDDELINNFYEGLSN